MKNKSLVIIFILLLMIGLAGTFWGVQIAEAASGLWNSCPRGETNCRYPGKCNLYIDTNSDRICDRSQSAPQPATVPPTVTATPSPAKTKTASIPSVTATPSGTPNALISGIIAAGLPGNSSNSLVEGSISGTAPVVFKLKHTYYFLPILLVIGILYAVTWTLSAKKLIKNLLHRKIWNLVLLISTLISALLGVFLILAIDFNIQITLPFNILFWHVEAGIALSIIAVFHIFWHWRYFTKMFKVAA